MAPEVIKNTNIKLIHRLTSIDDRQLIGSTMSASGIQLEHVAVYRPGEALMSYEDFSDHLNSESRAKRSL